MKKWILSALSLALLFVVGCQKEPVVESATFSFNRDVVEVKAEGESVRLIYEVLAPVEGLTLDVKCDAEWVTDLAIYPSFVDFKVTKNDSGAERSTSLRCSYNGYSTVLKVVQAAWSDPLTLTIEDVEATAVVISVAAQEEDATWIGQVVGKEWFESYSEEDIFAEDMNYYYSVAEDRGVTLEEFLSTILSRGSHSGIRMSGLDTETDYVVYIYGMNTNGEKTTSIYSKTFTTTAPYQGNDVTFDFDITCERAIADITITPSHEGVAYYNNLITREDFEAYGGDINAAADAVIAKTIEDYLAWEYTLGEVFEYNTDYVATNYQFEAIANTEYVAFAFKWNEQCERLSEVSYEWFTVGDIPPSDNVLSMEISDVTQTTFYVDITTTNNDPYVIFPVETMEIAKLRNDKDIFAYLLETYGTSGLTYYLCEGNVSGTFSDLEAGTEYAVLLFGYEAGVLTTSIVRQNITTAKAGDINACIYNIEISNVDDREADVTITPSDYSVWYYWNVFEADATEQEILAYIEDTYNRDYYADYWEFSYYEICQGKVESHLRQLSPSTEYKIVIVPMNPDRYEITGEMRFGGEFTTNDAVIADISIWAGFKNYYDGDEAYAINPDYMTSYKGYVIIPMTVEVEGDCSGFLYSIFDYVEGLEDPEQYDDNILIDNLYNVGAYWSPAYFRGVWDKKMMIAAVAFDKDDNPSPVYRHCFTCVEEEAGDAQEFIDLYMGGITTYGSQPKSVVFDEGMGIASLKVEAQEAPRKTVEKREHRQGAVFSR